MNGDRYNFTESQDSARLWVDRSDENLRDWLIGTFESWDAGNIAKLVAQANAAPKLAALASYLDYAADFESYRDLDDGEVIEFRVTVKALKDNRAALSALNQSEEDDLF